MHNLTSDAVLPNGYTPSIPLIITASVVLKVVTIIAALTPRFLLTLLQQGNAVRANAILRYAHIADKGMLASSTIFYLMPKVLGSFAEMASREGGSTSSSILNPVMVICLVFFSLYRVRKILYSNIERQENVFELNDPSIEQELRQDPPPTDGKGSVKNYKLLAEMKSFMVTFSLWLHQFLNGFSVGLSTSSAPTWHLLGAEATHILVAAFYIGSERSVMEWKLKMVTIYIVLYSMVSTLGIDVAIYIIPFTIDERNYEPFFAVCRAVGAGALLYVILFGIRDKHEQAPNDIVSWFLGLSLMMLLQIFILH